jgi:hypothetical protein
MRTFKQQLEAVTCGTLKAWLEANPEKSFNLFFRKGVTASFVKWNDEFCEVVFHRPWDGKPLTYVNPDYREDDGNAVPHHTPMKVLCAFDDVERSMRLAEAYAENKTRALLNTKALYATPSEAYGVFEYLYLK